MLYWERNVYFAILITVLYFFYIQNQLELYLNVLETFLLIEKFEF